MVWEADHKEVPVLNPWNHPWLIAIKLNSLEPPDIVKHCDSVGRLGSFCCRRKKQHEAGLQTFHCWKRGCTENMEDMLRCTQPRYFQTALPQFAQKLFEVKVSQIKKCFCTKKAMRMAKAISSHSLFHPWLSWSTSTRWKGESGSFRS